MSIKKRVILIVTEEQPSAYGVIVEQTFKFLAALWKIDIDNIVSKNIASIDVEIPYSMIICAISPTDINGQQWSHLEKFDGKVPILGFYFPECTSNPEVKHFWGVNGFDSISGDIPIEVKSNQKHPYTHNLLPEINVENPKQCNHTSMYISGNTQKIIYNAEITLICSKGWNVFFGVDIHQLGMVSFKPFFKLIGNIIFYVDSIPHFTPGAYAAIRVDDFPTCTTEYLQARNHKKRAIKRALVGVFQLSPVALIGQIIIIVFVVFLVLMTSLANNEWIVLFLIVCFLLFFLNQYYAGKKLYAEIDEFTLYDKLFWAGHDTQKTMEFGKLFKLYRMYGVKLEYMVTSHILLKSKHFLRLDMIMPKTVKKMIDAFNENQININSHGRSHINESGYLNSYNVDVKEFMGLSGDETREHLIDNIRMLKEVFSKDVTGFVAPAWAYQPKVTKKIAANYFRYIVDSNPSYLTSQMPLLGDMDPDGFLHAWETWKYGMPGIDMAKSETWKTFIDSGIPIHFLIHGTTVGEQDLDIHKIIEVGFKSAVKWLFLEELVIHMYNYHGINLIASEQMGKNAYKMVVECKRDMEHEIAIVGRYPFSTVTVDDRQVFKIKNSNAWIPKLKKGRHSIIACYKG